MLEKTLHALHGINTVVYNECLFESKTENPLVGGDVDNLIGSEKNGNKPRLEIFGLPGGPLTLFSVTIGEAKKLLVVIILKYTVVAKCLETPRIYRLFDQMLLFSVAILKELVNAVYHP